jgi:SAM-dependent methyltransferase
VARTRWQDERSEQDSRDYVQRFAELAAEGADMHGEARVVDALLAPASHVLDAGCGTARVGAELVRRGHTVTAVDADPVLVAAAPVLEGLTVLHADLVELDLGPERFDAAVVAGNVLVFVTPGTERTVLQRLHAHVRPGGLVVTGFATDRAYTVDELDRDAVAVGLQPESRFATWDLRPWRAGADWAVSVLRVP